MKLCKECHTPIENPDETGELCEICHNIYDQIDHEIGNYVNRSIECAEEYNNAINGDD